VFLSCVFINYIYVFLTSGQDCNSGMQKRIHFRTDMENNICRPVNNSDVSLGDQFCKNITFILYIIYNVRYNNNFYPYRVSDMYKTALLYIYVRNPVWIETTIGI
jgi:hypothetical protein